MLKKIAIIGPESTGKSTLCEQLAQHYNTLWCPEYARDFLMSHGMNYTYDDLLTIAKGQVELEDRYISMLNSTFQLPNTDSAHSSTHDLFLFIDTNMYVMKVWCEFVFGECHPFILAQIVERKYDLYLLCGVDLPWVADLLREYPDLETRKTLYTIYKTILIDQPVPWVEISGDSEQRFKKAVASVDRL
jgi:NadR type nicotinamide-nucleotide adenylyltransferase